MRMANRINMKPIPIPMTMGNPMGIPIPTAVQAMAVQAIGL